MLSKTYRRQLILTGLIWIGFQNCASFSAFQQNLIDSKFPESQQRINALDNIESLNARANIGIDSPDAAFTLEADLQFRTTDTLFIQLFDPLGRKLARLELYGPDYSILMQRSGQYYSGNNLPEEIRNLKLPPLGAEDLRLLLLGLNEKPSITKKTYYKRTTFPKSLTIGSGRQKWTVIYHSYGMANRIPVPDDILIQNDSENISIAIHISNFSPALRKFVQ